MRRTHLPFARNRRAARRCIHSGRRHRRRAARSPGVRPFVSVDAPVVALTHVRLIDGTGAPARDDQTVVITGERISAVGANGAVAVPAGAQVLDLTGHTVMPGIVGIHDHMYYSSVNGSLRPMLTSYPKLFLSAGITTIRTTGSADAYLELNLKGAIDRGELVGPNVVVTGPYLQGPIGAGVGIMHPLRDADDARRVVRYWAEEGVTWFKAYTTVTRAELGAAIDEAHKRGVKVTAHLCSVGFREAVALGIDNLEHGFLTNTEWYPGKEPDKCPTAGDSAIFAGLDVNGADVQRTIKEMVAKKVAMTSTLAVFEIGVAEPRAARPARARCVAPRRGEGRLGLVRPCAAGQGLGGAAGLQEAHGVRARLREGGGIAGGRERPLLPERDRRLRRPAQLRAARGIRLHPRGGGEDHDLERGDRAGDAGSRGDGRDGKAGRSRRAARRPDAHARGTSATW